MRRLACGVALLIASAGGAAEVRFPLLVDYPLLRAAMARELGLRADAEAVLWGDPDDCRFLVLRELALEPADPQIRVLGRGAARVGFGFRGLCFLRLGWEGYLETTGVPAVGADWQLRLRALSSQVLDQQRAPRAIATRVWNLVRDRYESRLAEFAFDLGPPIAEARALLRACMGRERAAPVLAALDTLRPVGIDVGQEGLRISVAMDVPDATAAPSLPEPALAPPELEPWQAALASWDGFLVFVIKDLGLAADRSLRDRLFALLLRSRHQLLGVLAGGPIAGVDPVRALFLTAWQEVHEIVREAALHGVVEDRALRYLAFLGAGDALAALDAAAPGLGLEISADGLRRLARVLQPDFTRDPLATADTPDATLRELFEFHEPEQTPPEPAAPAPPDAWWWPGPRAAHATAPSERDALAHRLDRWVPEPDELAEYRDSVARLLTVVGERTADVNAVEPRFRRLYGHLVHTTAWQESCWRQFVRENGVVTYLRSKTGDIGIMQVNRRVWRGFFDLDKLAWDITYNVGAGAEILAQLLRRYGTREAGGRLENAARASYAAYNGGPDAYRRYRSPRVSRRARAIDAAFWEKFQAMAAGQALEYVLCTQALPAGRDRLATAPPGSIPKCCMSSRSSRATSTIVSRHASSASRPRARCV